MRSARTTTLGLSLVCVVVASLGFSETARAQTTGSDAAAAEVLFTDGRRLLEAGKAAEACPKLEESNRLDPGMGTQFFLGECFEAIGRTASAWAAFREVESAAKAAGRKDRQDLAKRRADALEPKLVRLQLEVPWARKVPGVEIRRNGVVVGAAQWGTPLPIDPGVTVLRVSAPKKVALDVRVEVKEQGKTQILNVPEPIDAPIATVENEEEPGAEESPLRTVGWVTAGVGAAGLITGAVIGLAAKSKFDSSKGSCTGSDCTSQNDVNGRHDAVTLAGTGTIVFVSSVVVVVAGVALAVFAPKYSRPVTASLSFDGASLGGRF